MPHYLKNLPFKDNTNCHVHATRTQNKIHLLRPNYEYAKKCIRYDIPNLASNTSHNIIEKK